MPAIDGRLSELQRHNNRIADLIQYLKRDIREAKRKELYTGHQKLVDALEKFGNDPTEKRKQKVSKLFEALSLGKENPLSFSNREKEGKMTSVDFTLPQLEASMTYHVSPKEKLRSTDHLEDRVPPGKPIVRETAPPPVPETLKRPAWQGPDRPGDTRGTYSYLMQESALKGKESAEHPFQENPLYGSSSKAIYNVARHTSSTTQPTTEARTAHYQTSDKMIRKLQGQSPAELTHSSTFHPSRPR